MNLKYSLGHKQARKTHLAIINDANSYSLTITLDPKYYYLPVHEQHRMMDHELRCLLIRLNRYFNVIMYTPEFTKDYNLHYHLYFVLPEEMEIMTFEQNFKLGKIKKSCIGRNYKLKKVDDPEGNIKDYPFKDIDRTKGYAKIENCLFQPYHGIIKGRNPWKLKE